MFAIVPLAISSGLFFFASMYHSWLVVFAGVCMLAIGVLAAVLELMCVLADRKDRRRYAPKRNI